MSNNIMCDNTIYSLWMSEPGRHLQGSRCLLWRCNAYFNNLI